MNLQHSMMNNIDIFQHVLSAKLTLRATYYLLSKTTTFQPHKILNISLF